MERVHGPRSAAMPATRVFTMLTRAVEAYRRQFALKLEGEPRAKLKVINSERTFRR